MNKYIDSKTRIKLTFKFIALDTVFALQRKRWYGWKTVSWIYPSIMAESGRDSKYIQEWLEWRENYKEDNPTQKQHGEKIMNNCKDKS